MIRFLADATSTKGLLSAVCEENPPWTFSRRMRRTWGGFPTPGGSHWQPNRIAFWSRTIFQTCRGTLAIFFKHVVSVQACFWCRSVCPSARPLKNSSCSGALQTPRSGGTDPQPSAAINGAFRRSSINLFLYWPGLLLNSARPDSLSLAQSPEILRHRVRKAGRHRIRSAAAHLVSFFIQHAA